MSLTPESSPKKASLTPCEQVDLTEETLPRKPRRISKLATVALGFISCLGLGTSCTTSRAVEMSGSPLTSRDWEPDPLQDPQDPSVPQNTGQGFSSARTSDRLEAMERERELARLDDGRKVDDWNIIDEIKDAIADGIERGIERLEGYIYDPKQRNEWLARQARRQLRKLDFRYQNRDAFGRPLYDENGDLTDPLDSQTWEEIERAWYDDSDFFSDDFAFRRNAQPGPSGRRPGERESDYYPRLSFSPRIRSWFQDDMEFGGRFKLKLADQSIVEFRFRYDLEDEWEIWIGGSMNF